MIINRIYNNLKNKKKTPKAAESNELLTSPYEITLYNLSGARQLLARLICVIVEVFQNSQNSLPFRGDLEPKVWSVLIEILKNELELNEDGLLRPVRIMCGF